VGLYDTRYYDNEEAEIFRGVMQCCGYRAMNFDEEDQQNFAQYGEHGIKLVPWDERRRFW
jgi:hypothetical protein